MEAQYPDPLERYMHKWNLIPDGQQWHSTSSLIQPVRNGSTPAVLKIPIVEEERRGMALMVWFKGKGAANILRHDDNACLMERITGPMPSLIEFVYDGKDDEATRILCAVADDLHSDRRNPPPSLVSLHNWFRELWPFAEQHGPVISQCAALARELLNNPREQCVLHGDLHHKNVLHSADRGWVSIDPKGLYGERAFDYANILCNPDETIALAPGRLQRQLQVISEAARLNRQHLLKWVAAWSALSACWMVADGDRPHLALGVAAQCLQELGISA